MDERKGVLLVFMTAVISGLSIFINSFGVKGFDSSVFTFSKNVVVATLLLALIVGAGQLKLLRQLSLKNWRQLATIGLVGGSIPFLLFFRGLQMTTGQASAFIHKTLFIYVAIFAVIFLKEKLTRGLFIGSLLLLAGNYLMLRPAFSLSSGHLLIFAAALLWAAENTYAKHVLKELPGNTVAFGRMFFGSAFILAFLAVTGKAGAIFSMSSIQYGWILLTAVLLLAYVAAFYNGLRYTKATTAACILSLGAPITTFLSWAFSGAAVSLSDAFGIVLIGAGVASVLLSATAMSYLAGLFGVKSHGRD